MQDNPSIGPAIPAPAPAEKADGDKIAKVIEPTVLAARSPFAIPDDENARYLQHGPLRVLVTRRGKGDKARITVQVLRLDQSPEVADFAYQRAAKGDNRAYNSLNGAMLSEGKTNDLVRAFENGTADAIFEALPLFQAHRKTVTPEPRPFRVGFKASLPMLPESLK